MSTQKITIHRALSELKIIDDRIHRHLDEFVPVGIKQKDKKVNTFYEEEEFTKNAQSIRQTVEDLIKRKNALKNAIVNANATTKVKIGEKTMTIADAINFKALIEYKKALADKLDHELKHAKMSMEMNNTKVESSVQKLLEAALGKDKVDVDETTVKAIRDPYLEANEFSLVDPLEAEKLIGNLRDEIDTFTSEVDATLSEVNAITFIEIEQ